jgi:hypothetical protein
MQAALNAVPTDATMVAVATDGRLEMIGQSWLQLLVGGWKKLSPALVPYKVLGRLRHLFMKVAVAYLKPLMGFVGPDTTKKMVRLLPVHGHKQTSGACMVSVLLHPTSLPFPF